MREHWYDVRKEGQDYYWYRGMLNPIYENPKWQTMAINVLAVNQEQAKEIMRTYETVTHQIKRVWLNGGAGDYFDYLARCQQAEMSEDDHQA